MVTEILPKVFSSNRFGAVVLSAGHFGAKPISNIWKNCLHGKVSEDRQRRDGCVQSSHPSLLEVISKNFNLTFDKLQIFVQFCNRSVLVCSYNPESLRSLGGKSETVSNTAEIFN
ncbi:Uncharacterised protein r2_g3545 [Pycnogonum litorale]